MNYEEYRKAYYPDPQPKSKFNFSRVGGVSLYFAEYEKALDYYTQVLGPPNYVEGKSTRGWQIGETWLTLFKAEEGAPTNMEFYLEMQTPAEAERLQRALIDAGGEGPDPTDELMYAPIRFCYVTDPFGTNILVFSKLTKE